MNLEYCRFKDHESPRRLEPNNRSGRLKTEIVQEAISATTVTAYSHFLLHGTDTESFPVLQRLLASRGRFLLLHPAPCDAVRREQGRVTEQWWH